MEKSRSGIIWNLLEGFLGFFLAIAILCSMVCFVRILWSVRKKKIFIRQNVYRMRIISYTLIIYILFLGVSDFFACQSTMQFFDMPGYRMSTYKFPLGSLLIGLLIAVVTEIYAQGVRMEEEQDLTV
ncbi:MAG: DUF2975 domain-containing protein [Bacteroides sp.]|nr:DUF2975 domain-containing protein [Bacteroides sp.]